MKFLIVLAVIVTIGYCHEENQDQSDSFEKFRLLVAEQSAIRNVSMGVVHTFSLDVTSVVRWREIVNNMTLNKNDKKSAQTFLDYVRYTFKLADEIGQENAFSYGKRFHNFKVFLGSPNSLTEKQLCYANAKIGEAVEETAKKRQHIEKYIANVDEKIQDIKEKITELKKIITAVVPVVVTGTKDAQEISFENLKEASKNVMDAITGKRVTKSLMIPMLEEIREAVKIEDKLVKTLKKICMTIDFHRH